MASEKKTKYKIKKKRNQNQKHFAKKLSRRKKEREYIESPFFGSLEAFCGIPMFSVNTAILSI